MERQSGFSLSLTSEQLAKLGQAKREAEKRERRDEETEMWETCKEFLETKGVNSGTRYDPYWHGEVNVLAQEVDSNGNPIEGGNHVEAQVALMAMGIRYGNSIDVRVVPTAHGPLLPFNPGGSLRVYPEGRTALHEGWEQGERPLNPLEHTWWRGVVDLVRQDLSTDGPQTSTK